MPVMTAEDLHALLDGRHGAADCKRGRTGQIEGIKKRLCPAAPFKACSKGPLVLPSFETQSVIKPKYAASLHVGYNPTRYASRYGAPDLARATHRDPAGRSGGAAGAFGGSGLPSAR